MSPEELAEWISLGASLREACPERYQEILGALRDVVGAQTTIASFDHLLMLRQGRPKTRYEA